MKFISFPPQYLRRSILSSLLAFSSTLCVPASTPTVELSPSRSESKSGEVINFSLLDYKGKHYELRRSDKRAVVLFFTSFGCPIARQALPRLRSLRNEFSSKGVAFWLVNSSPQEDPADSLVEMLARPHRARLAANSAREDAETLKLELLREVVGSTPVLRDELQLVAHQLGVTQTCEAVAIDPKNMRIIYHGAIIDKLSECARKPTASQEYLAAALEEFLADKPVSTPQTTARG